MWTKSHSIVTTEVSKEQIWKLFADVNNWHKWDEGIHFASMEGEFTEGNFFTLKPKGGPKIKIQLYEVIKNKKFVDLTRFPLAKMYGEHSFVETNEGLKMTTTMKVEGLLSFLWVKLVAKGIADGLPDEMPRQIQAAKQL